MSRAAGRPPGESGPVISRSEILDVAARVIGEYGFDGASLRRIASEAGISYGTLQYHFRTKDLIWKAVVDEVVVPAWRKSIEGKPGQFGFAVKEFVGKRLEAAVLRPGLSGAVLTDSTPEGEERLRYVAETTSAMREKVRQRILGLQDLGILRIVDVDALRVVTTIGLASLSSAKVAVRELIGVDLDDESQRKKLVEGITDLLLYGLLPR